MGTAEPTVEQLRFLALLALEAEEGRLGVSNLDKAEHARRQQLLLRLETRLAEVIGGDRVVRLLEPDRTTLTPGGWRLAEAARQVIDAMDGLLAEARTLEATPTIRVSCYPANAELVARVGDRFAAAHLEREEVVPRIELREVDDLLRSEGGTQLLRRVAAGTLDVAVLPEGHVKKPPAVGSTFLYSWPLVAVVPEGHELAGRQSVSWRRLDKRDDLLVAPRGHRARQVMERAGMRVRPRLESNSVDALVALAVEAGQGVALVPGDVIPLRLLGGHWPIVDGPTGPLEGAIGAFHLRKGRPVVLKFVEDLAASAAKVASGYQPRR